VANPTTFVYINRASGSGHGEALWLEHEHQIQLRYPDASVLEDMTELQGALRALGNAEPLRLIVIGGDGTIHLVLNAVLAHKGLTYTKAHLEVLLISSGTGCDYYKTLQEKKMVTPLAVDVGKEKYFVNSCSLGLGGYALSLQRPWHKKYLPSLFSYMLPGLQAFLKSPVYRFAISQSVENTLVVGDFWGLMIYCGRYAGGGMLWAPLSDLSDGLLDFLKIRHFSRAQLVSALASLLSGAIHKNPNVAYDHVTGVDVRCDSTFPIEMDGELYRDKHVVVRVVPQAYRVGTF
jgi:diacylglycerol kinase (ATP)